MTTSTRNRPLIGYQLAALSELGPGRVYTYLFGQDGVYIRGERPRLSCQFQIGSSQPIRGLDEIETDFVFEPARIPATLVEDMLTQARQEALDDREILFHFIEGAEGTGVKKSWSYGGWTLAIPEQSQSSSSCRPLDSGPDSSHARAVVEVHSHHNMRAFFSLGDDRDEQGFRIYTVIGRVLKSPEIRVRIGLHGYFWEIPSSWVFESAEAGLKDAEYDEEEAF